MKNRCFFMEKYSRGRRGAPAKGVGRSRGARVRIPLSPLAWKKVVKFLKKSVDKAFYGWYYIQAVAIEGGTKGTLITEQHNKHRPWKFLKRIQKNQTF